MRLRSMGAFGGSLMNGPVRDDAVWIRYIVDGGT